MASRDTISQRIALEGGDEVKKQLADIGQAGEKAFKQISDATNTASGSGLTNLDSVSQRVFNGFRSAGSAFAPLRAGMQDVQHAAKEFGHAFNELTEKTFPHFREVLALSAGAAVIELAHLSEEAARSVQANTNMAEQLGVSVGTLEVFKLAAARSGIEAGALTNALTFNARVTGQAIEKHGGLVNALNADVAVLKGVKGAAESAAAGITVLNKAGAQASAVFAGGNIIRGGIKPEPVDDVASAYARLGIAYQSYAQGTAGGTQRYLDTFAALSKVSNVTERANLAQQLYGRGARNSIPAILELGKSYKGLEGFIEHNAVGIEEVTQAQANVFLKSLEVMKFVGGNVKEILFNQLNTAWIPVMDAITNKLIENNGAIQEWGFQLTKAILPVTEDLANLIKTGDLSQIKTDGLRDFIGFFRAMGELIGVVVEGFRLLSGVVDIVAQGINSVFGTHFTGTALVVIAYIGQISGLWKFLAAGVALADAAISTFITGPIARLVPALIGVAAVIGWPATLAIGIAVAVTAILGLTGKLDGVFKSLSDMVGYLAGGEWSKAWESAMEAAGGFVQALIDGPLKGLIEKIKEGVDWWNKLISNEGKSPAGADPYSSGFDPSTWKSGGGGIGFDGGGSVRGPGTATSDSVNAHLSDGEFVHQAAAVNFYGRDFMYALNRMALPRFSMGGLAQVRSAVPRFAMGGIAQVRSGTTLNLTIGSETFEGLIAPDATAQRMVRVARQQGMRSAGRKPGWFGAR